MATKNLIEIKKWFESGRYPTAEQFHNAMDSFWHKDEQNIPMQSVENLIDTLDSKASTDATDMLSLKVDATAQKAEFISSRTDILSENLKDVEEQVEELTKNGTVTEEEKASWNAKQNKLTPLVGLQINEGNYIYTDGSTTVTSLGAIGSQIWGSLLVVEEEENPDGEIISFNPKFCNGMVAVLSIYGNTPIDFEQNTDRPILYMSGYNNVTPTSGQWIDYCIMSVGDKLHINRAAYNTTGD